VTLDEAQQDAPRGVHVGVSEVSAQFGLHRLARGKAALPDGLGTPGQSDDLRAPVARCGSDRRRRLLPAAVGDLAV
jgi:hypothetical protein